MRCLAFRHLAHEGLGLFQAPIAHAGWSVDEVDTRSPDDVPEEAAEVDLLVVLGGPMSVREASEVPTLSREMEILRRRLAENRPTLGVCLGAQMLAAVLGARVYKMDAPEVGWLPVEPLQEGRRDPVFRALVPETAVNLHWHEDAFDLPPGAAPLARSAGCANQAFRVGRHTYGIQFHPEVPAADLPIWTGKSHIPLDPETRDRIERAGRLHEPALKTRVERFLSAYLRAIEAPPAQ